MNEVEIIQLIRTRLTKRGDGKSTPVRVIEQYWSMEGKLIFEIDNCKEEARE